MRSSKELCRCIVKRVSHGRKWNFQEASQKVHLTEGPGCYCPQINYFPIFRGDSISSTYVPLPASGSVSDSFRFCDNYRISELCKLVQFLHNLETPPEVFWLKSDPGSSGRWRSHLGLGGCHGRSQKPPRRFHHPLHQGRTLGNLGINTNAGSFSGSLLLLSRPIWEEFIGVDPGKPNPDQ